MSGNAAVHRFEYDGWHVVIELDGSTFEGALYGHADLRHEGEHKCRIALAGKHNDAASAIGSLADKSRAFIDDWHLKRVNGDAQFVEF
jgi:hypothetical protein